MFVISNGLLSQAEIVQRDRWERGPLEIIFFDGRQDGLDYVSMIGDVAEWNRGYEGGFLRDGEAADNLKKIIPSLMTSESPNVFLAPTLDGYSALHPMLASVVPDSILHRYSIEKVRANLWLLPWKHPEYDRQLYAENAAAAFQEYIWSRLARSARCRYQFFAEDSPLRLLADDTRYWMSRLYRIALARHEAMPETEHVEESWKPIEELQQKLLETIPADFDRSNYFLRRPRVGGDLWDIHDLDECEEVVDEMLDGCGLMPSIEPMLDVIHSQPAHEDFSEQYSWIKEDFERSFYSKRSRVKVTLIETIDEFPAWEHSEPEGYDDILFRDVLVMFNRSDQEMLIALRHGKTLSEIARERGHKGHACISRRLAVVKRRLKRLLS